MIKSFIEKLAKIDLQPHQDRAHKRLGTSPGLLVAHGLGSGKTITSITAADLQGREAVAVVPAALRENYRKEIQKVAPNVKFHVMSYEAFTKNPTIAHGRTLIIDEGHRAKNSGSSRAHALLKASEGAHKRIVLTGTPIPNKPEDLASVINIAAGRTVLPTGEEFRKRYIRERVVKPGLFDRLKGVSPGVSYEINNANDLGRRVRGLVDFHPSSATEFPQVQHVHHDVEMDHRQKQVYDHVMRNVPKGFFRKMERNLPPSKSEAQNLNAFLTGARIASNTPAPYQDKMSPIEGFHRSAKLQRIVSHVHNDIHTNPRHKAVIYSSFIDGGITPLSHAMTHLKIPHHVFTGGLSDKKRKQMVADYNEGRVPLLMISGAGAEGLDLKGTRAIHIVEPHWNDARIHQVIGRGVRFRSHSHLPEAERHVRVHTYHSVAPRSFMQRLKHGLFNADARSASTDRYLHQLAADKKKLNDQFNAVLHSEGSRPVSAN